jgi:hypothetical protein
MAHPRGSHFRSSTGLGMSGRVEAVTDPATLGFLHQTMVGIRCSGDLEDSRSPAIGSQIVRVYG